MFRALFKTLATLLKPYFFSLLLLSLGVTAVIFAVFFYGMTYILGITSFVSIGWLEWILDWLTGVSASFIAWFMFPAVVPLIASLFMEQIAGRIEKKEYDITLEKTLPFWPEVWSALGFTLLVFGINLLVLPLYFTPLFPFIYYPMNTYLIGREFFELVAGRHIGRKQAHAGFNERRMSLWIAGGVIVLITNIPLLNLFAPFVGIALMVHLYQQK